MVFDMENYSLNRNYNMVNLVLQDFQDELRIIQEYDSDLFQLRESTWLYNAATVGDRQEVRT
jgi:hypothetical protein